MLIYKDGSNSQPIGLYAKSIANEQEVPYNALTASRDCVFKNGKFATTRSTTPPAVYYFDTDKPCPATTQSNCKTALYVSQANGVGKKRITKIVQTKRNSFNQF